MRTVVSLVIFVLFSTMVSAQQRGVAHYRVQALEPSTESAKSLFARAKNLYATVEGFSFALQFDEDQALFYRSDDTFVDLSTLMGAENYVGYGGRFWQDASGAFLEQPYTNFSRQDYLHFYPADRDWTVTDETKEINGYVCYRATSNDVFYTSTRKFVYPIVAWFCPEIPVPFGPLRYGGLPGLIMELQTTRALYGLQRIEFKDQGTIEAKPDWPVYTEEELVQQAREKGWIKD